MNSKGLTLTEVIVAIFILVIVNVSLLATFVMLKASGVSLRNRFQAINILSAKLESLKNQSYDSIISISNLNLTIDDNSTSTISDDDTIGTYSQVVTETQDSLGINKYKTVNVNILWQEGSYLGLRNVSEALVTMINN